MIRESPAWTRRLDKLESYIPLAALAAILIFLVVWIMLMFAVLSANGSVLEKESAPPINLTGLTLSEDTRDRDITISVDDMEEDALFENKTQMISTTGADDLDIDGFPPKDVTVLITNESVMVTKNPVQVEMYDLVPDIRDEIIDAAKEHSNGSVIIDLPDDYPQTETTVVTSTSTAMDADAEEEEEEDD